MKTLCPISAPIMRQVVAIAGTLVVIVSILGFLVHPYFFFGDMFIGTMLIIYSTTGLCPMAYFLSKLPCNTSK